MRQHPQGLRNGGRRAPKMVTATGPNEAEYDLKETELFGAPLRARLGPTARVNETRAAPSVLPTARHRGASLGSICRLDSEGLSGSHPINTFYELILVRRQTNTE